MRLAVVLFLVSSAGAFAATLNPGDVLRVTFTVMAPTCPGGPCDTLLTFPSASGSFDVIPNGGSLWSGSTLLGTHAGTYGPKFRAASSQFQALNAATVDFSSIIDGSIDGLITFSISGGQMLWVNEPGMYLTLGRAHGLGYVISGTGLTVTSASITSAVPEPTTGYLAAAGAVLILLLGRGGKHS